MRVGLVCPYPWDVPGGVRAHVHDLAIALMRLGHEVAVLAPVTDEDVEVEEFVDVAGRALPVPYNGSVARLAFGPWTASRVRRWVREGGFDVLHVHEPLAPSVSVLTLWAARGPLVATFHASVARSRTLEALEPALRATVERISASVAVSDAAREYVVTHVGPSCVVIPNGVDVARFASADPLASLVGGGPVIAFVGRVDEPRKGLPVLLAALPHVVAAVPDVRLAIAGPGDLEDELEDLPRALRAHVIVLGTVSEADKASLLAGATVYCAPNTGGESFGIVLLEAMAAGAPVVASELEAFARVLDGAGELVEPEDPTALAEALVRVLGDAVARTRMTARGRDVVARYDWGAVAGQVVAVYDAVVGEKVAAVLDD